MGEGGWIFLELHIELFSPSFAHGFINENKDTIIFMVRTDNKTYLFLMFYRVLNLLIVLDFLNDLGDLKPTKHYVNLRIKVKDLNGYKF